MFLKQDKKNIGVVRIPMNIKLNARTKEDLRVHAEREGKTVNAFISGVLEEYLASKK